MLSAVDIFNPLLVPARNSAEFSNYGEAHVKTLGTFFFKDDVAKQTQIHDEYRGFKDILLQWQEEAVKARSKTLTSLQWALQRLMALKGNCNLQFELLTYIAEVMLAAPVSNDGLKGVPVP